MSGLTESSNFPTVNPLQSTNGGGQDIFVAKLNPAGSALIYSTYLGGSADEAIGRMALDSGGNVYVTGSTLSSDFPAVNSIQSSNPGGESGIVAKINGVTVQGVTPQAARLLQAYPWPGNVRELEKSVRRGVIFADGGWIQLEHLGLPTSDDATWLPTPSLGGFSRREERALRALTLRQREALRIASLQGAVRRADLNAGFGISESTAQRDLVALIQAGVLGRSGSGRGSRYFPIGRTRTSWRTNRALSGRCSRPAEAAR